MEPNVRLLGDTVLVKADSLPIEKTEAGIYLPEKLRDKYITGTILATGDDVKQVEHNCKVVFEKSLCRETVIMGESLFIIKENQILYKLV
jgi:co-chaperonin GroES (HSP10)